MSTPLEILARTEAVLDGHFVLASKRHASKYVNKDAIYPDPRDISDLCAQIAGKFVNDDVEVVVGPEKGGIILSQWTAHHLTLLTGRRVLAVYAEKEKEMPSISIDTPGVGRQLFYETGRFVLKRGYDKLVLGKLVLGVEDILTTGTSLRETIAAARRAGARIVGAGALCNRGKVIAQQVGVPRLEALVNVQFETWKANECPLCQQGVTVNTNVGKGKEFLAEKQTS